jgi:amino acid transporter
VENQAHKPIAAPETPHFHKSIGLISATAINMNAMCGVGPFVTIPAMISVMGGPQAMLGWILGAVIAIADGMVWAELGAAMPGAGGTYLFLREAFQYRSGKLLPFLFVWTAILSLPLILSIGVVGFYQYLGSFVPDLSPVENHVIGLAMVVAVVALLYRRIESVPIINIVLWAVTIAAMGVTVVASFSHFDAGRAFDFPPNWIGHGSFLSGLGGGLIIALYDYTGYGTVAYMGAELKNPGRVMPGSIIISILAIGALYLSMQVGLLGAAPWQELAKSTNVASMVVGKYWGHKGAILVSVLVMIAAAASIFTGLLGSSRVLFNAARDGVFFSSFGKLHPRLHFPHVALIVMGLIVAIGSFFAVPAIINMLTGVTVLIQSLGQVFALTVLRRRQPTLLRPYRQTLYPLPSLISLAGWSYAFVALDTLSIILSFAWVAVGCAAFLIYARARKTWPWGPLEVREEFLEHQSANAAETNSLRTA